MRSNKKLLKSTNRKRRKLKGGTIDPPILTTQTVPSKPSGLEQYISPFELKHDYYKKLLTTYYPEFEGRYTKDELINKSKKSIIESKENPIGQLIGPSKEDDVGPITDENTIELIKKYINFQNNTEDTTLSGEGGIKARKTHDILINEIIKAMIQCIETLTGKTTSQGFNTRFDTIIHDDFKHYGCSVGTIIAYPSSLIKFLPTLFGFGKKRAPFIEDNLIQHVGIYIGFGLVAEIGSQNNAKNTFFNQPLGLTLLADFVSASKRKCLNSFKPVLSTNEKDRIMNGKITIKTQEELDSLKFNMSQSVIQVLGFNAELDKTFEINQPSSPIIDGLLNFFPNSVESAPKSRESWFNILDRVKIYSKFISTGKSKSNIAKALSLNQLLTTDIPGEQEAEEVCEIPSTISELEPEVEPEVEIDPKTLRELLAGDNSSIIVNFDNANDFGGGGRTHKLKSERIKKYKKNSLKRKKSKRIKRSIKRKKIKNIKTMKAGSLSSSKRKFYKPLLRDCQTAVFWIKYGYAKLSYENLKKLDASLTSKKLKATDKDLTNQIKYSKSTTDPRKRANYTVFKLTFDY